LGKIYSLVIFVAAVAGVHGAHCNDLIHFGAGALGPVAPKHEVEAVEEVMASSMGLALRARDDDSSCWERDSDELPPF
jgi:hypothetical protein